MRVKSWGIIGGTFDPPHFGHLLAAEWARQEYNLEKVVFMPAAWPPHKQAKKMSEAKHRLQMVRLAVQGNPAFIVSDWEMKGQGKSYTINTAEFFCNEYPDADIYFIVGADSLLTMDTWKDVSRLVSLCKLIVVSRPGYVIDTNASAMQKLPPELWERTYFLEIPGTHISSTEIRERVKNDKSIRYLLPASVEDYICQNRLYREVNPEC